MGQWLKGWKGALLLMVGLGILSFALYALVLSWEFALLLIGSLVFHEYGHLWAAKRVGMETKGIYLIPFLGGVAVSKGKPPSQGAWVFVALAGPLFGFALAAATALAYVVTGWTVLAAAAWWMTVLNLFNMLPIYPLDGGQVVRCIAYAVPRPVGFIICGTSVLLVPLFALWGGSLLLCVLLAYFATLALIEFLERPRQQKLLAALEEMERHLASGNPSLPHCIVTGAFLYNQYNWKWPSFPELPTAEELLPPLRTAIAGLREPLPLPRVAPAFGAYVGLASAYLILSGFLWRVPGILEGLLHITGQ